MKQQYKQANKVCPIDGFKAVAIVNENWRKRIEIEFKNDVYIGTGEIHRKVVDSGSCKCYSTHYRGEFENYKLRLIETEKVNINNRERIKSFRIYIQGSFHKNSQGSNSQPFSMYEFELELRKLSKVLHIDPDKVKIENIEFGHNLRLGYSPDNLIEKLKEYRKKPFYTYEPKKGQKVIGKYCPLTEFQIKFYNKGLQSHTNGNILRYEIKIYKMRKLLCRCKKSVIFLSDLLDSAIIYQMNWILIETGRRLIWEGEDIFQKLTTHKFNSDVEAKGFLQRLVIQTFPKAKFTVKIKREILTTNNKVIRGKA